MLILASTITFCHLRHSTSYSTFPYSAWGQIMPCKNTVSCYYLHAAWVSILLLSQVTAKDCLVELQIFCRLSGLGISLFCFHFHLFLFLTTLFYLLCSRFCLNFSIMLKVHYIASYLTMRLYTHYVLQLYIHIMESYN